MRGKSHLNRTAILSLFYVILVAIGGIIVITLLAELIRSGVLGDVDSELFAAGDEALSILGNVAAAAVGGLVGWLTRDVVVSNGPDGTPAVELAPDDD